MQARIHDLALRRATAASYSTVKLECRSTPPAVNIRGLGNLDPNCTAKSLDRAVKCSNLAFVYHGTTFLCQRVRKSLAGGLAGLARVAKGLYGPCPCDPGCLLALVAAAQGPEGQLKMTMAAGHGGDQILSSLPPSKRLCLSDLRPHQADCQRPGGSCPWGKLATRCPAQSELDSLAPTGVPGDHALEMACQRRLASSWLCLGLHTPSGTKGDQAAPARNVSLEATSAGCPALQKRGIGGPMAGGSARR